MTVMTDAPAVQKRRGTWPVLGLLIVGVVLIPAALAILTTSAEAPDAEAYVRMAFAAVAGQAIAIATVVGLLVASIVRRLSIGAILANALIAIVVTSFAAYSIGTALTTLLQRLGFSN